MRSSWQLTRLVFRQKYAAADPAKEEDIEAINGARARQGTTFVSKCVVFTACVALGTLIGVGSFHLAGPPTRNTSSKQVAITSGEIEIRGFTKVGDGRGECLDESSQLYDYVRYEVVANAQACANKCSECPGGGQFDSSSEEILLRGFWYDQRGCVFRNCNCYIENSAQLSGDVCNVQGGIFPGGGRDGTGEINSSNGGKGECWKVNSKSSKSPKRGSSQRVGKRAKQQQRF